MADDALDDVRRSVAGSPSLATHFYLSERLIPWLSGREEAAVEEGFKQAIERHYDGAVPSLAAFYSAQGRFTEAGNTYSAALRDARDPKTRGEYLLGAGLAYAQGGDIEGAKRSFEDAIRNESADARPYTYLVTLVLGPRHQLKAAQEAVAEGVRQGADDQALYDALADAAEHDGDTPVAETALQNAADLQPSFAALFRLGTFYLDQKKYGRAALTLRRAIERNPRSADTYFYLGLAEESDYRFPEAENDLRLAVQFAPTNAGYRSHYDNFEHKLAQGVKTAGTLNEESAEFRAP
jgi:tetratricopeptide (TPR) repeat protein